jgi:hypothetical protein
MWNDRQILIMTAIVTAIVTVLTAITTGDWVVTAFTVPLVASAAFWSLRISRRIGFALQRRYGPQPPPPPPPPLAPTTERPVHAQRRRHRRRQRGRS